MIRWVCAVALVSIAVTAAAQDDRIDVWLDVDVAAGIPGRDVDDALAMIQAFKSPELRIRGVSAVFGNAPLADGLPIATEIAWRFGPANLKVHPGAASAEELGQRTEASDALAAALREGPLHLLALGPLTNAATVLMRHPELHARIQSIVIVAGRRPGQRFTYSTVPNGYSFRDFNFENDPKAMQVLLDSAVPLVYAPWEVSSHLWLTQEDLDTLAANGPAGQWVAEKAQGWHDMWLRRFRTPGFNPFDTLGVAWLTHPELMMHFEAKSWIEDGFDDTYLEDGEAPVKPYLLVDPDRAEGRTIVYCYYPRPQFQPILVERLQGD